MEQRAQLLDRMGRCSDLWTGSTIKSRITRRFYRGKECRNSRERRPDGFMSGRFGAPGERWNEMDFERLRRVFLARQGGSEVALDPG